MLTAIRTGLSFLKSPKIIGAILGVALLLGGFWYVTGLIEENGQLKSMNVELQSDLEQTNEKLKAEQEYFRKTISNYDELMSQYITSIEESEEASRELRLTIDQLKRDDEFFQQCMDEQVPDDLLDGLFGENKEKSQ